MDLGYFHKQRRLSALGPMHLNMYGALLEKFIVSEVVKIFPVFHEPP
jgi:hypothetical protein